MRSTRRNPDVKAVCLWLHWKQPENSLQAAWKQPSRDHLLLPVWFRRCIWGSYVAPIFFSSVFISSPEIGKRHTQTHRPVIFSSRQISKRKWWHEHTHIQTVIDWWRISILGDWVQKLWGWSLFTSCHQSVSHSFLSLVGNHKQKKRCTPLFWASTTPSFYFQIRPRWWLKLRQRVSIASIRCSRWANLWKIMLVVPRQQLGCCTTVRMNWGNCRCQ